MDIDKARLFAPEEAEERDALIGKAKGHGASGRCRNGKGEAGRRAVVADRLRERIRAEGPTAPYGPERQYLDHSVVTE